MSVPGGTPLNTIAKASGISTSALRKLNPHLRTAYLPPGSEYVVMVPPESLSRARAALPAMMQTGRLASNDADVLLPDDLLGLSEAESKSARHGMWNEEENLLSLLPKPKRRSMRKMIEEKADDDRIVADGLGAVAEEFAPRRGDRDIVMYRVGSGDTLIGVARQFAIDIDDLARDNSLDPDDMLKEGSMLKLMVKRDVIERWKKTSGASDKSVQKRKKRNKKIEG
jgi:membrane-bound lytic murein transglycosylase D